jgi:putative endonuclease
MKGGIVYILCNPHKTVFYIGVTNNIKKRMWEHKTKINDGFTKKYNCTELMYFESYFDIGEAIMVEKRLKRWRREWKLDLIQKINPEMKDLSAQWFDENGALKEIEL